jgi:hypothetical protein
MSPTDGKPDVLNKMDALLNRQRTGEPPQLERASAAAKAERAAIPVLTDIVPEANDIPVLTEALSPQEAPRPPQQAEPTPVAPGIRNKPEAAPTDSPMESTLNQLEEFLVQELENRIALELTASLDHALNELLERSREHIRHVVREAIQTELTRQLGSPLTDNHSKPRD